MGERRGRIKRVRAILTLLTASLLCGCTGRGAAVSPNHGAFGEPQPPAASAAKLTESLIDAMVEPRRATPVEFEAVIEPWRFAGAPGRRISTPNFRIYTTVDRAAFVEQLPMFYELALAHYTSALGELPQPEEPIETYIFGNRTQWQAKTQQLLPDQADVFNSLGRGGFTTRGIAVLYYIDSFRRSSRDTFAIAAHEGWHQYTQRTFRHQLPIWLEEGVATYMESFNLTHEGTPQFRPWVNTERRMALGDAVRRGRLIPLDELLRRSPQAFLESGKDQLLVYYGQVWALTRFLAEGEDGRYRAALEEVLQDAAHGRLVGRLAASANMPNPRRRGMIAASRTGPQIILEYFNPDLQAFDEQYQRYIRTLVERGRR